MGTAKTKKGSPCRAVVRRMALLLSCLIQYLNFILEDIFRVFYASQESLVITVVCSLSFEGVYLLINEGTNSLLEFISSHSYFWLLVFQSYDLAKIWHLKPLAPGPGK